MEKNNFKNLLIDLYRIYNPANIEFVDELVENYNRLEIDALRNIFIKYNKKSATYYDPLIGTDKYILDLIKEYDAGLRSLENVNLAEQTSEKSEIIEQKNKEEQAKRQEEETKKIEIIQKGVKEEVIGEVDKKIQNIEKYFIEKEDGFKKALEEIYANFEKKLSLLKQDNDDVTIRIFSTHTNSVLKLPNKKIIAGLGKGSRLIVRDEQDKVIGLEITDITYDGISDAGKPLVEIFVQKV